MEQSSVKMCIDSTVTLNNGVHMPALGLGVYQSPPGTITQHAIRIALKLGYRHVDTAAIYGNEMDVGPALKESGVPREQVFVTTKLWNADQGYDSTFAACSQSLKKLGLKYLDLYLIHWPVPQLRNESWRAMVTLMKDGKARSIGVSNFTIGHLEELLGTTDIIPAVNQVEFHPFLFQKKLLDYCSQKRIRLEAYAPLTRGEKLDNPFVKQMASKYSKSPAQVLIRWSLQHGLVVIPKSVKEERIRENSNVFDFEISQSDMQKLDSLNEDFRTCWDPTEVS
jgi:diketogulonate reductase-like aldo/keto reductase